MTNNSTPQGAPLDARDRGATAAVIAGTPRSIASLTSLRFFAAAYVLFLHSGSKFIEGRVPAIAPYITNFLENGYLGVSLFFVLSGFILTYVYENSLRSGKAALSYAVARFARLYPVYLLSLAIAAFTLSYLPALDTGVRWPQFLLLHSWLPPNLGVTVALWNPPAWTLSVELVFYIVFPLVARIVVDRSPAVCVVIATGLATLIISLRLPSVGATASPFDVLNSLPLPLLRLPEFMLGSVMATLFKANLIDHRRAGLLAILSIGGLMATLSVSRFPIVSGFAGVWFALIIYFCASSAGTPIDALLRNRVLVFLGGASYAIYILQTPVRLFLGSYLSPHWPAAARTIYYPVLISLSSVVYHYYEEPVRRSIRRMFRRTDSVKE